MYASHDTITDSPSGHAAEPTQPRGRNLVSIWAGGRRRLTPWAYPRLRALAAMRLIIGIFLAGLGALIISGGYHGWAAIPFAGAALHFAIAYLDIAAARRTAPSGS